MSETDTAESGYRAQALSALNTAVLARNGDGKFNEVEPMPAWWGDVFGSAESFRERCPFLEDFAEGGAAEFWAKSETDEVTLHSGIWEEVREGKSSRFFEAIACRGEGGEALLIVVPADDRWQREQAFVQTAHDESLSQRQLRKELEKKQILLECIMHDLGNPLATVLMNLQHVSKQLGEGDEALKPALGRAIAQAERQRELIRSIAQVFAADLAGARSEDSSKDVLDLSAVTAETIAACAPAATEKGITLCPFFTGSMVVIGDSLPLSRVVENLLVNAIRHSPEKGRVTIGFDRDDGFAVCRIEDEGPGIDVKVAERLFEPFSQGGTQRGQSGLGLYFCRMTVEMWGGSIVGRNRPEGGACFEFRLPLAKS